MGAIGGLFGLGGGASGTGYAPPQLANIQTGVETDQAKQAYGQNQSALAQQQQLLNALQGQGGIGNQNQVYDQLQGVINGTGPNPAQAMLNQETAKNVAMQGALMAGQRGASSNVGLLARQAAMQGAGIQQNAALQGATMQANQSLNALNQAGGIANTQAGNLINATQGYTGANQAEQGNLLNAIAQQNQARVSNQGNVNSANAGLTQAVMPGQQSLIGGALNSVGSVIGGMADGGQVPTLGVDTSMPQVGPKSSFGQFMSTVLAPQPQKEETFKMGGSSEASKSLRGGVEGLGKGLQSLIGGGAAPVAASKGGLVDVVLSPGEKVVKPQDVKKAAGGDVKAKTVPGKAEVKGDSLKNDKVPAKLPPGSVVIPRTKANDDPASFVRATLAKRGRK